jgi:hypothetical protein
MQLRTLATSLTALCLTIPALADEASEKAAGALLEAKLAHEKPADLAILKAVAGKDIVVVRGSMDHIEQVLAAAKIRHTVVEPDQVAALDLKAEQIVMVDCPGIMPDAGVRRLERFVRAGGLLYTTDWALLNVIQKAFPGTIRHNGQSTLDEVTPVVIAARNDDLMSQMLLTKDDQPQWWLEGGSYPIQVLDAKRVQVLATSHHMGKKYGAAPVVVRFKWDDGEVIHVVSHFYRQASAQGPAVAAAKAVDQVEGLTAQQKAAFKADPNAQSSMANVSSSYAFQRMTSNLVVGKQKRNAELDQHYGWTPSGEVVLEGRKAQRGDKLKVVSRDGRKVRVRDDRGNEAVIDEAAIVAR